MLNTLPLPMFFLVQCSVVMVTCGCHGDTDHLVCMCAEDY